MLHAIVPAHCQSTIRNVSAHEFKEAMDTLEDEVVLDLRTREEVQKGKIRGAFEIDFYSKDLKTVLSRLDRNKPYLLYCAAGGRSAKTAELMKSLGFKKIYNLETGYDGWLQDGMPVVTGDQ